MTTRFHPQASEDLVQAIEYFESQQPGLGKRLGYIIADTLESLEEFPDARPTIRGVIRRCPLRTFPFSLLYSSQKEGLFVLAVAHNHREPDFWVDRVSNSPQPIL